jgi:SpoVK/Ycf46/Vps4 family AAA+-type ATPase
MTLDLTHLNTPVRELAFGSVPQRIRHVHTARWVRYPRAELALEHLERLIDFPPCARMPCLLLYGDSGIGKTMILEKFARQHPMHFDKAGERQMRPVVTVQMPPAPDERRLYAALLDTLGAPFFLSDGLVALETLARRMLAAARPRILIIDEVHHLLAGTAREQRRALNVLKSLANVLQIPVVAVGTRDALQAISTDPQVVSRFEPMELPRWSETDTFRAFLLALVRELPLRKASPLADRACTQLLLRRSEGITGRVCWIVGQAAEQAIRSGAELIDVELLDRVSQRLHLQPS